MLERIFRAPHGKTRYGSATAPKRPKEDLGAAEDQHMGKRPPSSTAPTTGRGAPKLTLPGHAPQPKRGTGREPKTISRKSLLRPRGYWQRRIRYFVYRGTKRNWRRCLWVKPPRRAKPSELHRVRIKTGQCYGGVRLGKGGLLCDLGPGREARGWNPPLICWGRGNRDVKRSAAPVHIRSIRLGDV